MHRRRGPRAPHRRARPTIAHLRVVGGSRPALTDAVTVGHLLRAALQRRFDQERDGTRSAVFSGHDEQGPRRDQHAHAHYLALPGRDSRRIDHLFVWAPEGFGPREVTAIAALRDLRMRDAPEPFRVALVALGDTDSLSTAGNSSDRTRLAQHHADGPDTTCQAAWRCGRRRRRGSSRARTRRCAVSRLPEVELCPARWMRFTTHAAGCLATPRANPRWRQIAIRRAAFMGRSRSVAYRISVSDCSRRTADDRRPRVRCSSTGPRPDAQRTCVLPALGVPRVGRSTVRRQRGYGPRELCSPACRPAPRRAAAPRGRPCATAVDGCRDRVGASGDRCAYRSARVRRGRVVPVEFKSGKPREGESVLWPPEQIQLCAQVLLLRDAGLPRRACAGLVRWHTDPPRRYDRR